MAVGDQGNIILLFENQASDATGTGFIITSNARGHYVSASGTFGGGTVTIEMEIGGNWAPVDGGEFTAAGVKFLEGASGGKKLRAVLAGATGPSITVAVTK
jgi:hypothetical protein